MYKERKNKTAMGLSEQDAQRLVNKFLDGSTTPAEERVLYAFFASHPEGTLSAELEKVRAMMGWYASLYPGARSEEKRDKRRVWMHGVAAAVGVIILVCGALAVNHFHRPDVNPLYAAYDGSYVVREGVRTSDLNVIFSALTAAEELADSLDRVADRELSSDCEFERRAIDAALAGIADRALAEQIRHDILDDPS